MMINRFGVAVLAVSFLLLTAVDAIQFRVEIPARLGRRCFYEYVLNHTLVILSATTAPTAMVGLDVFDGVQDPQHHDGQASVKVAFTTSRAAEYEICITNPEPVTQTITVLIQHGPEARDYSRIAKREHLEPLVVAVRRCEDRLIDYHKNVLHLRSKHMKIINLTEKTASRVVLFCVLTVVVLLIATLFQFLYFRSFLRSKKII